MKTLSSYLVIVGAGIALFAQPGQADIINLGGILDASQVVDGGGSTSTATGVGIVTIDTTLFTITTDLSWSGLSGPADRSHLHDAPEGVSRFDPPNDMFFHEIFYDDTSVPLADQVPCGSGLSPVGLTNCAPPTGNAYNVLQLSADDGYGFPDFASLTNAFLRDGVYLDIHTQLYPAGEIRGQLLAPVPEPASLGMFGAGLLALGLLRCRAKA
jgi:CHRD domain/PEP-CTERM motif